MGEAITKHLTQAEHDALMEEIRLRRTPETFVEGKWSVSPLNRMPEVLGAKQEDRFPSQITLRDITLRTIEQAPGVVISGEQRLRLSHALVEAGVRSLVVAWLSVPHAGGNPLADQVRELRAIKKDLELAALGASRSQVEAAIEAGVDVFHVYGPSVPAFHTIYGAYGRQILRAHWRGEDWRKTVSYPRDEAEHIAAMVDNVSLLRAAGVRAGAFTSMLHYATPEYLRRYAKAAYEAGAAEIGLGDGASGLGPEAWAYIVRIVREHAPGVDIVLHTHNSFGLVMASTLAALHAGARVAEVSVNGICSAAGQADLAEMAAALEIIYGVRTGIDLERMTDLSVLVQDISGIRMAPNKAITGKDAWAYTEEAMREESAYAPVHKAAEPHLFGNQARYVLGAHSGTWSVLSKLDDVGLQIDEPLIPHILTLVQNEMLVRGRALADEEFAALAVRNGATAKGR